MKNTSLKHLFYALAAALAFPAAALAATPVVFWDGASADYDFSSLARTVGGVTYTLSVNSENASVSDDKSHIAIGSEDQKWTVAVTASEGATKPFGSTDDAGFTAIVRFSNVVYGENGNRALANFYNASAECGASIGYTTGGTPFPLVNNVAYPNNVASSVVLSPSGAMQTIAIAYGTNPQGGTAIYIDGVQKYQESSMTSQYFATPTGFSVGGVAGDGSGKLYAAKGMKIHAIALFDRRLSESEVAEFEFPSILVSKINERYGSATEITLNLVDGDVIVGDTAFTSATNVKFACNGSITILPPAGNATAFDFSDVSGEAVVSYSGTLPAVSGNTFTSTTVPTWVTDSARWTNTIALCGMGITGPNFNNFGNTESAVMLSGVYGWVNTDREYTVPIVLENGNYDFALKITDGNSPQSPTASGGANINRCARLCKVLGNGDIVDGIVDRIGGNTPYPVFKIYDASGFCGNITLKNVTLIACDPVTAFSDTLYNMFINKGKMGSLYIVDGKTITLPTGKSWNVKALAAYGTIEGGGRLSVSGSFPDGCMTNDTWTGTVAVSNVAPTTPKDGPLYPFELQHLGSQNSTIVLSSIGSETANTAYLTNTTFRSRVVLEDSGDAPALRLSDGISYWCSTFTELAGSGTFTNINANVYQGLTINVMTNFTGVFAPSKMTVTFGTAQRAGRVSKEDQSDTEYKSKLYIDPDAVLSVPAGFRLWAPMAVAFNGPVNFTTDAADYDGLVLFDNTGTSLSFGRDYASLISINGAPIDRKYYMVKRLNGQLVVKKKHLHCIILR